MSSPNDAFWSPLSDSHSPYPTLILRRLSDSIFFYLNAVCAPYQSGLVEPAKLLFFFRSIGVPDERNVGNLSAHAAEAFYSALGVRFERVQEEGTGGPADFSLGRAAMMGMGGARMTVVPALTAPAFTHVLDLNILREPDKAHALLNRAIATFQLQDPHTQQLFPPLPRWALPAVPDQAVVQKFALAEQAAIGAMQLHSHQINAVAGLAVQGARNVQEASRGPDIRYVYR